MLSPPSSSSSLSGPAASASVLADSGSNSNLFTSSSSPIALPRLTLQDIHIPVGFEIAKDLGQNGGREYPSTENILAAVEVLKCLRGRMPDSSEGQVAACDYCRRRKIRCDRVKPHCGSCSQSGRKCTTEDMLRKRGPPSKKERAILEAAGIIFRGTRPHRRRRTVTASFPTTTVRRLSQDVTSQARPIITQAPIVRARANSTNSKLSSSAPSSSSNVPTSSSTTIIDSGCSWMRMLSLAAKTPNPFQDSPVSSPSGLSNPDSFNVDAGACDYVASPITGSPPPPPQIHSSTHGAQLEHWRAIFGGTKKQYRHNDPHPYPQHFQLGFKFDKRDVLSTYGSFDGGALDWIGGPPSLHPANHPDLFSHPLPPSTTHLPFTDDGSMIVSHPPSESLVSSHVDSSSYTSMFREPAHSFSSQPLLFAQNMSAF